MIQYLEEMINLLYPRRCPLCQDILTDRTAMICIACRKKAVPIREPRCKKCGKSVRSPEQEYCFDCSRQKHAFTRGWAVFSYEKEIKQSVYQFKFHNKREYSRFYGAEMVRTYGKEIVRWHPDVLIPIPMYKKKQRQRGYNQAELLAREIGEALSIPVDTKILYRVKKTTPQKELTRKEREINLKNAFKTGADAVKLKKVLLVDDIYTTGATMDAAAQALLENGVKEVRFFVLCTGRADF